MAAAAGPKGREGRSRGPDGSWLRGPRPKAYPPPAGRRGEVVRGELLAECPGPVRVLVCHAPPGYGKTTFAAQWCRNDDRPTSWLTVREADNDPVLFLLRVADALESLETLDPRFEEALMESGP